MIIHNVSMIEDPEDVCLATFCFKSFCEAMEFIKLASENDTTGLSFNYRRSDV